jgi:hypothetical protein
LKVLFTNFTEQVSIMRRSTVPSLPPQLGFPGLLPIACNSGACFVKNIAIIIDATRVIRMMIITDATIWSITYIRQLELSITLLDSISSTGITHHCVTIKIVFFHRCLLYTFINYIQNLKLTGSVFHDLTGAWLLSE